MHSSSSFQRGAVIAASLGLVVALSGCAGQDPNAQPSTDVSADSVSIGVFVTNAFGDRSFFDAAAASFETLESDFGADVTTYEAKLDTQAFAPLLQDAADANELVFVLGDQAVDTTVEVASQNPDTTFVFVNGTVPRDGIASVALDYNQICYPGGVAAAYIAQDAGRDGLGFVGGFQTPALTACQEAFTAGAAEVDPALRVTGQVAGTFSDPNKGYEVTNALVQQGIYVVYAAAGLTSQGVLKAAQDGLDVVPITMDFGPLAPESGAAALTHIDVMMVETTRAYVEDGVDVGGVTYFGYADEAVDWTFNDQILSADQITELEDVTARISSGELDPESS